MLCNMDTKLNEFTICSFNCNGLNNSKKRKDVFEYLRNKQFNIYLLQETHLKEKDENFIRTNWGYNLWLSGSDSNKNGVAILFNNNFEYKLLEVIRDPSGCYIALDIIILKKRTTIINIYAPSSGDCPDYFNSINNIIDKLGNEHIIVAGD